MGLSDLYPVPMGQWLAVRRKNGVPRWMKIDVHHVENGKLATRIEEGSKTKKRRDGSIGPRYIVGSPIHIYHRTLRGSKRRVWEELKRRGGLTHYKGPEPPHP